MAREEGRYLGIGLCTVVESTTYGSRFYKSAGIPGSGHEAVWLRIEPCGAVNASVGLMGTGQGYETALAQAVAEGLGVDSTSVTIRLGNTDVAPYGMGSRGARGGTAGGGALYLVGRQARERVLAIAAALLKLNSCRRPAHAGGNGRAFGPRTVDCDRPHPRQRRAHCLSRPQRAARRRAAGPRLLIDAMIRRR